jgi:hypothetical protein
VKGNNDNKSVFFFCYHLTTVVFIIVNISLFLFVSFEAYAVSSQQPSIVSNNDNNLSNTPSDTIHKTVNAMVTNNMARLMNDTILSSMTNPTSKVVATNNNSSQTTTNNTAGTMSSQSNSTNTSGAVTKNNNNQTHMDVQKNVSESINENGNENKIRGTIKRPIMASAGIIDSNQEQQLPALNNNNTKTFADNQPVVLQIQKSTDTDIANKLEDIKNKLLNQPMAINKNNLTATIKSIEESNNIIIKELSEIKSLINGSSPPPPSTISPLVISGTISTAIIVSVVAILVFLWVYNNNTGGGIKKLNYMKLWRK